MVGFEDVKRVCRDGVSVLLAGYRFAWRASKVTVGQSEADAGLDQ